MIKSLLGVSGNCQSWDEWGMGSYNTFKMFSKYIKSFLFPHQTFSVSNQKFSQTIEKAIVCFALNVHTVLKK